MACVDGFHCAELRQVSDRGEALRQGGLRRHPQSPASPPLLSIYFPGSSRKGHSVAALLKALGVVVWSLAAVGLLIIGGMIAFRSFHAAPVERPRAALTVSTDPLAATPSRGVRCAPGGP